jgi:hypothetical protein
VVGLGDAEQVADDRERQAQRELVDELVDPRGVIRSSRPATICSTRGRMASIRFGVNAWVTRRRSRECSGGSELSMFVLICRAFSPNTAR